MPRSPPPPRVLLTCDNDAALREVRSILSKSRAAPDLVAVSEIRRGSAPPTNVVNEQVRVISARTTPAQLAKIKESKACRVEYDDWIFACPDVQGAQSALAETPYTWGLQKIDADIAWDYTKGERAKVAILDTGIEANHAGLIGRVKPGVSFVENVPSEADDNGHGTHCAGIVAATPPENGDGMYGVAPAASLFPVKVMNYNGQGLTGDLIAGIEWCLEAGVDIVSMSLLIMSHKVALRRTCEVAHAKGLVLVAAVGNDWQEPSKRRRGVGYPARYDCVIGVGATDRGDTIAPFSNRGKGVDIVAPGVDILSTYRGNRYRLISGTSQACPHVSGVVALLKSYKPELASTQVRKVILETGDPLGSGDVDKTYGYGLVNASGAIEQVENIVG